MSYDHLLIVDKSLLALEKIKTAVKTTVFISI